MSRSMSYSAWAKNVSCARQGRVWATPSHSTNTMATSVKFLSFRPLNIGNLRPTPNVTEWEAIRETLATDTTPRIEPTPEGLQDKELKVLANYRGWVLWLEGGVTITRCSPKTAGGHGCAGWPASGIKEEVLLNDWAAEVEFV